MYNSLPQQPKISGLLALIFMIICYLTTNGQSKEQLMQISSGYETSKLNRFQTDFEADYALEKVKINALAKKNNWKIKETLASGKKVELQGIGADGSPLYYETYTDEAGKASRANTLYSNGLLGLELDGAGMQVGVWDSGIALDSHIEYTSRLSVGDEGSEVDAHATRVAGSIISTGLKRDARGVANQASVITHDWTRDKIEVTEAAANGLLLSNHSYGIKADRVPDWYFGSYTKVAQDWDKIMYNAPYYLMVTAAGNSQRSMDNSFPNYGKSADGFDVLLGFTLTKNGITVAGANTDIDADGNLKNAEVSAYSSFGPVDDGRIKPDLAGYGGSILSTDSYSNTSYETSAGTSMATPGVTGALLLLQQYNEQLYGSYLKAATLKGLALQTADDVNEKGPDYKMGWGVMNAKKASEVIFNKDFSSHIAEETLNNGETFTMTVTANESESLIASISWTDPESDFINRGELNNTTAALVNDLDIRITKNGEAFFPWKLNPAQASSPAIQGDNSVDPYEQIELPNAKGTYTITITHKGSLKNGVQDFSLIVSGVQMNKCSVDAPEAMTLDNADETSVTLAWNTVEEGFYEIQYKTENQLDWNTEYTGDDHMVFQNLTLGQTYIVRTRTFCSQNVASEFSPEFRYTFLGSETVVEELRSLNVDPEIPFNVYPNPAVDEIHLNMEVSDTAMYRIVSATGVELKANHAKNATINVTDLATGIYILQIQDFGVNKSAKFYKY